ncbi:MAG: DUF4291 domain-containing protein [Chitinophagaceae bacterium]
MKIQVESYTHVNSRWPKEGQHILAYQDNEKMVVYQAYNHEIADYAVREQRFGGSNYSYSRMSWIKPNFLWMMYRCGWASKENQERVLAIWINKSDFENILEQAVYSSFNPKQYSTREQWQKELNEKEVRLQWDPDHDPHGNKQTRRAIQLGMKGDMLQKFGKERILAIEDVTAFVIEQHKHVRNNNLKDLLVPVETIYQPANENLVEKLELSLL